MMHPCAHVCACSCYKSGPDRLVPPRAPVAARTAQAVTAALRELQPDLAAAWVKVPCCDARATHDYSLLLVEWQY